ncbi:MAG: FAD-dependent oxidoreductase, partial [Clostridia bacterium]|nr:FAD-dependent oxidoreductase [Clostridia bacterium]
LYAKERSEGRIKNPRENILAFMGLGEGIIHLNTTRVVKKDPTDAFELSEAETEARRQVLEMFVFLKENSAACRNAQLVYVAPGVGIRESRKLKGVHVLSAEEIKSLTVFDDTIAVGNYSIDIHNPTGTGTTIYDFKDEEYYSIPYRSLLPKEYFNLLVAGRCLSATHEAQSAVRIMPICACLGQAAGVAAALAKKTGRDAHTLDTGLLRETLRGLGAVLELKKADDGN